jgi:Flp pilus assembly secretin CpaC
MSRRRTLMLASVASVTALGMGCYLPELFTPIPGLVLDVKSCLEPSGEPPNGGEAASDPPQAIQMNLLVVGFNASRAGTTLLADADNECQVACGAVKDDVRLRNALARLRAEGCIRSHAETRLGTLSGRPVYIVSGGEIPVHSTVDSVSVISYMPYGIIVETLPTVGKNGLIHLQLKATVSEPKSPAAGPGPQEIDTIVEGRTSIALRDAASSAA